MTKQSQAMPEAEQLEITIPAAALKLKVALMAESMKDASRRAFGLSGERPTERKGRR